MGRDTKTVGKLVKKRSWARTTTKPRRQPKAKNANSSLTANRDARVARLTRELKEALDRQTATAGILQLIAGSPSDVQPVLDSVCRTAQRLCGAGLAGIAVRRGDVYRYVATSSANPEWDAKLRDTAFFPSRDSVAGRVLLERRAVHVKDLTADPEYGYPAFAAVGGARTALGVPLLREGDSIGVIFLGHDRIRPFTERQIEFVRTFADQAVIAIENVRLFEEVQARTKELQEALEQQTATSDVLQIISKSTFNLEPVFRTLVENAVRLCGAQTGMIFQREGELMRLAAANGASDAFVDYVEKNPIAVRRGSATGRAALERRTVHILDAESDPEYAYGGRSLERYRSIVAVPLMRGDTTIGTFTLWRHHVQAFTSRQIALVETFADQAVVAIENVRLFNETKEALERQTATADILKVIASSPDDVLPVFDAIANSAKRLLEGFSSGVFRFIDGAAHLAAFTPTNPTADEALKVSFPLPLTEFAPFALVENGEAVQFADTETAPLIQADIARERGFRSILMTPLMSDGRAIGLIAVTRVETGSFADHHVRLMRTFADQAVIAIQNARQFNETKEALERETATADILRVIAGSPSDVQPVFDAVADRAMRMLDCWSVIVIRFDGEYFQFGAARGALPDTEQFVRQRYQSLRPDPTSLLGRCLLGRTVVSSADALAEPDPQLRDYARKRGLRSVLVVPLLRDDGVEGALVLTRAEPGLFAPREIALVQTFADQAVIAIQNVRMFTEVQARTRDLSEALDQQTATADVLKVISRSAFDLKSVLTTLIESAKSLCGASLGIITLRDGEVMRLQAESGCTQPFIDFMHANPIKRGRETITGRVFTDGKPVHVADVQQDAEYNFGQAPAIGAYRAVLAVPLMRDGSVEGVLLLGRPAPGPFTQRQVELVQTFADQAVIAIENVRLFEQVQERTKELSLSFEDLRAAQDRLVQTEKLASLGQLTAGIAHEIKNPLNFVNNFSALSAELIDELDDALRPAVLDGKVREEIDDLTRMLKSNLERVVQHGKRADSIVKNMLLHSREGSGEHRPADINAIVEESLNLAYHGARAEKAGFNITLQRDLDPAAGTIDLYPQEIVRVLLNLISNGFYAATKRKESGDEGFQPTLSATTKNLGNKVEIRIRDNGTGIPPEVKEKMFNPFFTTKPAGEGTGLGLSMSHDIVVKQHGGEIEVDTMPGAFTEFVITLPRTAATQPQAGGTN
jgi:GAF domain-containing protein